MRDELAMRAAAKELDAMIAAWGTSEGELTREYKEIRHAGRERKHTLSSRHGAQSPGARRQHSHSGVVGLRVRQILEAHADSISFFVPETALPEAVEHLAAVVVNRGGDPEKALAALKEL
jgi:hypothetical protein